MPQSELKLVKRWQDFVPKRDRQKVPVNVRGIYILYKYRRRSDAYDVVYVGMVGAPKAGGIRHRLRRHSETKGKLWTHFSVFEVWDNIHEHEVAELEGLFRQIYSRDQRANRLNKQKSFKKLKRVPRLFDSD